MSDPINGVDPVSTTVTPEPWSERLVLFLRVMAGLSLLKGLYHWAQVCGIGAPAGVGFDAYPTAWQVATVFFAVIDLVAAVGLWLAAAWGAVLWLFAAFSMIAVELLFDQVYGGRTWVVLIEIVLVLTYFALTFIASRERAE